MTTAVQTIPSAVVITLPDFQKEIAINAEWLAKRNKAIEQAKAVTEITTQAQYDEAAAAIALVTKLDSSIEKMRLDLTRPFENAKKLIKGKVDEACVPLQEQKERLKKLAGDYYAAEQRRIRVEAAEKELREREAAEEEAARQEMERSQAADLGLDAPAPVEIVEMATPVESAPRSENAKVQMRVSFDLIAEAQVPRSFLTFDPRKANEYIRQNKDDIQKRVEAGEESAIIPGLKFTVRPDISGR
ncbi:MAG: hypothetical protein WCS52_02070 [bacterium]